MVKGRAACFLAVALGFFYARPAAATPPTGVQFLSFSSTTVTVSWTLDTPASESPLVVLSTMSDFSVVTASVTGALGLQTTTYAAINNTTYYFKVKVSTESDANYSASVSSQTAAATPTTIVFDEISTAAITASAYAPTPAFANLSVGLSSINVARDGTYAGWRSGDRWTTKAAIPTGRSTRFGVGVVGGKIYVIGGEGATPSIKNEEYDPAANSWTTKADLPTGRWYLAAGVVAAKIYIVGGTNGSTLSTNEEYDPAANSWATRAAMPTARHNLSAAVVSGKIYLVGGNASSQKNEQYDPATNTWATKAAMSTGRGAAAVGVVGGKVYVAGGDVDPKNQNEEYDPVANSWATKALLPTGRYILAGGVVGGKMYVIGGSPSTENEEYDPASNTWATRAAMLTPRWYLAAGAAGGKLYVLGGDGGSTKNEEYDPGEAQAFTGLTPNTSYSFKAQARDSIGRVSNESPTVSTYTLAAASSPLSGSAFTSVEWTQMTVAWSSGTVAGGFNGPGATYLVSASTRSDFVPVYASSLTANLSATVSGLGTSTTFYLRVQAINTLGTANDPYVLGSTVTLAPTVPTSVQFSFISSNTLIAAWTLPSSDATPLVVLSTTSNFNTNLSSASGTVGLQTTTYAVADNTTYYFKVKLATASDAGYSVVLTTFNAAATPTTIVFDEIFTGTITASAYAPTPAFANLNVGLSSVNVAIGGVYAGWRSGNSWTTRAAMSTGRYYTGAGAVGGKLYVVGGNTGGGNQTVNEEYDPATNAWTTKAAMPTARNGLAAAVVAGRLYAIGGYDSGYKTANEEYDPASNSWATRAAMPTARGSMSGAAVGGKLYVIGADGGAKTVNEEYDPATNVWTTRAAMPTGRYIFGLGAISGKIYVVGGTPSSAKLTANEEYDPAANSWATKAPMPTGRYGMAAAVVGGKLYAVAGTSGTVNEEYDPAANAWATRSVLPTDHYALSAAAVGGKLYAIGGNGGALTIFEEYDPGFSQKFTSLTPNTSYSFKAQARNSAGRLGVESAAVSTYTLAAASSPLTGSAFTSVEWNLVTVAWSSGTAASGFNGPGASYLVQASTRSDFVPVWASSQTANLSADISGLLGLTTYYFRVRPLNVLGTANDPYVLGSTTTPPTRPTNVQFTFIASNTLVASWTLDSAASETPLVVLSTMSDFSVNLSSAVGTLGLLTTSYAVADNTTYYLKVKLTTAADAGYSVVITTLNAAATPTTIVFDEILAGTITASAYAPTPAFANLRISSINVAIGGTYAGWRSGDSWTTKAAMPKARTAPSAVVAGGKIYLIGGYSGPDLTKNEEYDPAANSWVTRADMPTARGGLLGAAVGGKIYIVGGYNGTNTAKENEEYDPVANSWTTKAPMPSGRSSHAVAALGGKLYAIGGSGGVFAYNEEYDPATNAWTTRTAMSTARYGLAAMAVSGKIYAVGGHNGTSAVATNEAYDPAANSWATKSAMPTARYNLAAAVLGGKFYAVGGSPITALNEEYDPAANAWITRTAMFTARQNPGVATVGGKLYAIGGYNSVAMNEVYDPGFSQKFTSLTPNTSYSFKAQARNSAGRVSEESPSVSTYTLAAASSPLTGSAFTSVASNTVTVAWSSGSAVGGFNGPGAAYLVQVSTRSDFVPVAASSQTANLSADISGLSVQTNYYFRVRPLNVLGTANDPYVLGSTVTLPVLPAGVQFTFIASNTLVASWTLDAPASETPLVVLSTMSDFSVTLSSASGTVGLQTTTYAVADNTTYYFKVKLATASDTGYTVAIATFNAAGTPTTIAFDEISTAAITASAYAPTPAFANLSVGQSAINVARDGSYAGWRSGDAWTTKAARPLGDGYVAASVVGGKVYVVGGSAGSQDNNLEYDPAANSWSTKANMPTGRQALAVGVVGGKLYALGGDNAGARSQNEEYDPAANTWATKAPLPIAQENLAAGVVGGKIYALGGFAGAQNQNQEYDPAANAWTARAVMPTARYDLGAGVVGGKIYALGGAGGAAKNEEYDPAANSWATKAPLPTARDRLTVAVIGGKIYALGGVGGSQKENEEYDPAANTWATRALMPTARYALAAGVVGGKIYAVGGGVQNEEYDPGFSQKFTSLTPNTSYSFKARARNSAGRLSEESPTVSTYTLAAASSSLSGSTFASITSNTVTVSWSSGSAAGGFNGLGASYLVQASTRSDFVPVFSSSQTANLSAIVSGLAAERVYSFRVRPLNVLGTANDPYVLGSTATSPAVPASAQFSFISSGTLVASWTLDAPASETPLVVLSTMSDFSVNLSSVSGTVGLQTTTYAVADNTTYYFKVKLATASDSGYTVAITTFNAAAMPTTIAFDEISTAAITASAYAPTPAFANQGVGQSAINVARDGNYAGWRSGDGWTTKAAMSTARYGLSAAVVGGKLYAVGGYNGAADLTTNEEYDPAANVWTTKAAMSTARNQLAMAVVGGKLYAIGGNSGAAYLTTNEEYDPAANAWTAKRGMPTARNYLAAAVVGGKLYVVGGNNGFNLTTNEEYDPATNAWTTRAVMSTARHGMGAAAVGGKLYAVGGNNGASALTVNEEYDPAANSWATKSVMPTGRYYLAAPVLGGKLYAVGGNNGSVAVAANEEYDPAANIWAARSAMPMARYSLAVAAVGGKLYAIGGYDGAYRATNEEYDPGFSQKFAGLAPNVQYAFKALARNSAGRLGVESTSVSTYTLAVASSVLSGPTFSSVGLSTIAVSWSSGSLAGGFNGPGASYLVQASTRADFIPISVSSLTANLSATLSALSNLTTFYLRVQALNVLGTANDPYVLGSTVTLQPTLVSNVQFSFISSNTLMTSWTLDSPASETPFVVLSTMSDFSVNLSSAAGTVGLQTTTYVVADNTTYYFKVKLTTASDAGYSVAIATFNAAATPTTIAFDEISTAAITASAYAPTPAFANQSVGSSGINVARDGNYAGWRSGDAWTTKSAMSTARYNLAVAVVGGRLYAIGGNSGSARLATNEEYDPASNSWSTRSVMPSARERLAAAAAGGKLYAIGGYNGTSNLATNEEYDPAANSWSTKSAMPAARINLAAASVGGKLYVVGGDNSGYKTTNEEYDPAANAWTTKAAMSTARNQLAAAAVGGKLYAVGGYNGSNLATNEEYDPTANAWATKAVMPTARYGLAAAVAGGKLYAVGGSTLTANEEYDPAANIWSSKSAASTARDALAAAAVGGKLYAVGGYNAGVLATNEEYDPGFSRSFTGLSPNVQYSFKAQARNSAGRFSAESPTVSTYTLASASSPLSGSAFTSIGLNQVTVSWSSGTTAGGFNGPGASYLVSASTSADFVPVYASSQTANLSADVSGLVSDTTYYFQVRATNVLGTANVPYVLGSTRTPAIIPANVQFSFISSSTLVASWTLGIPAGDTPLVVLSTTPNFSVNLSASTGTLGLQTTTYVVADNTTYYFKVKLATASDAGYSVVVTTFNAAAMPTTIAFDEISTAAITASAYAPTPAFANLSVGQSAVNVARDGTYAGWRSGDGWTTKAVMPTARYNLAAAVVGGKLYAVGGYNTGAAATTLNEEYDPAANSWATKSAMPTARTLLAAAAAGGKLYALAGYNGVDTNLTTNEEYDPAANSWSTKAALSARNNLAAVNVGGKLYAVGGYFGGSNLTTNEEYDPATNSWTARSAMSTARSGLAAAAVGGKLYAVGGDGGSTLRTNEEYNPATNSWATRAVMPTARANLAATVVGGKLYAVGGSVNEEYDPASNSWATRSAMPTVRYNLAAAAVGGKLYAIGGGGSGLAVNEEYDPGFSQKFAGLSPNVQYSFKAQARNSAGRLGVESATVSTYTLAAASTSLSGQTFTFVEWNTVTVAWSSGSAAGGFNGPGASYLVQASTRSDFVPVTSSSQTANLSADVSGLLGQTLYYFRVKPINALGTVSDPYVLGSTTTPTTRPTNTQFSFISSNTLVVSWTLDSTASETPLVVLSTTSNFNTNLSSAAGTLGLQTTTYAVADNTTYYFKVKLTTASDSGYTVALSTFNAAATPTTIAFDEISTAAIVASAYAPTPAFANQSVGQSAINVARDGTYAGWRSGDSWATRAAIPTARSTRAGVAVVGGKIYVIGGEGATPKIKNEEYDPVANSWVTRADLPTARWYLATGVVDGKIYVVGGYDGASNLTKNEEYDPAANSWATRAPAPTVRRTQVIAVLGGKMYVTAGYDGGYPTQNEAYDPALNTWTTKAALPTGRSSAVAGVVGGKMYVVGGDVGAQNQNEEYDPAANSWATKAAMPTGRALSSVGTVSGKLYVLGGTPGNGKNEEYDPAANAWATRAPVPTSRWYLPATAGVVGGKLYVLGGDGGSSQNEEYDPGTAAAFTGLTPNTQYAFKARSRNSAGRLSEESPTVSTYTLAAASSPLTGSAVTFVEWNKVSVLWSSGTAAGGFNGPGASYLVQASTRSDFVPVASSSQTANLSADITGLASGTAYYLRVRPSNVLGTASDPYVLGSTTTLAVGPTNVQFTFIASNTLVASWTLDTPASETPLVVLSTMSNFSVNLSSALGTVGLQTTTYAVADNTTYYFKVKLSTASDIGYSVVLTTFNAAATPTTIVFDEVFAGTITASAYAPTPAFANQSVGSSGINVARDGNYAGWRSGDAWTTKAVISTGRQGLAVTVVGGKLYAVGGNNGSYLATNEEYDPAANSWTTKAVVPTVRGYLAAAAVGGKLYAVGGYTGAAYPTANEEYDPAANSWSTKAALPTGRGYLVAAVMGGKLYAVGGDSGSNRAENEAYDPATNSWSTKAAMSTARYSPAAAVVGGKLYVVGGNGGSSLAVNEEYDPAANSWTTKAAMPTARERLAAAAVGGKLYAFGGNNGVANEEYDPIPNSWSPRSGLPTARTFLAAAAVSGKIYALGGNGTLAVNEEYDPGFSRQFTGLTPNTQYSFKAQARNSAGRLGVESPTVSTYTLAVATLPASGIALTRVSQATFSVLTVSWASGPVSGAYNASGASYQVQISTRSDFVPVLESFSSSGLSIAANDLTPAATYYARVRALNAIGAANDFVVLGSTRTQDATVVTVSSANAASASLLQGSENAMLKLSLRSPVDSTTTFRSLTVYKTGTAPDSAVSSVKVYYDADGNGAFSASLDVPLGAAAMASGKASVDLGVNASALTSSTKTFFAVYQIQTQAVVGNTLGADIHVSTDIAFDSPYVSTGALLAASSLGTIGDGASDLTVTPASLAPTLIVPGDTNVGMLKLTATASAGGTSILKDLVLYLDGSLPSNKVTAVKVFQDVNGNGTFEPSSDLLWSSGADLFSAKVATLAFAASQSSRTVSDAPSTRLFVSVSLAADAPAGSTFTVRVATPTEFHLDTPLDTVIFSTTPMASGVSSVQTPNTVSVTLADLAPADLAQGLSYAVLRASMTVNTGSAQVNRITVNRTGAGADADVVAVKVYLDAVMDGGAWDSVSDSLRGQAAFSGASAVVNITTVTLNAGSTAALFVVYEVAASANAGDTLSASLLSASYVRAASAYTTVAGNFPFASSTGTVRAVVNTLTATPLDQSPGSLLQGATNVALLRLTVQSNNNPITWSSLALTRLGTAADSAISAVKVYRDENGDGVLQTSTDSLVSSGGDVFSGGAATLGFSSPQSATATAHAYFVAVDLSPSALVNATVGVRVSTTAAFGVNSPNIVSTGPPNYPFDTVPVSIAEYADTVSVSSSAVAPASADPGAANVPMVALLLHTDVSDAGWTSLQLYRGGSGADADVKAAKVYYDINGAGTFDANNIGNYQLVTSSALTFGSQGTPSVVTLAISPTQTLNTASKRYFVVVDFSTSAAPGHTVSVRASDKTYFTVAAPNVMATTSFESPAVSVSAPPKKLYMLAYASAPASAFQSDINRPMLSLALRMEQYSGLVSGLTVARSGSGQDSDISRVRLYEDDGDGVLSAFSDTQFATAAFSGGYAALSFAARTVTTSTKTWFVAYDIAATAVSGNTVGAAIGTPGSINIASPHSVAASGFPVSSGLTRIDPTQNGVSVSIQDKAPASLAQGATAQLMMSLLLNTTSNAVPLASIEFSALGTAADADIARLRVYSDNNANGLLDAGDQELASAANPFLGGKAVVGLSPVPAAAPSNLRLLVAADMAAFANYAKTFGVRVASTASLSVTSPNYVVNSGFPMDSSVSPIAKVPDTLTVNTTALLSGNVIQGSQFAAFKILAWASRQSLTWTTVKLQKSGTLADSGVTQVRIYKDADGDSVLGGADLLIGTGTFSSGVSTVLLSSAQTVATATGTYFAALALDSNATVGATIGLSMQDASYFTVASPDSVAASNLPVQTSLVSVLDAKTPTVPVVTLPDGAYGSSFESIRFVWTSSVALGSLQSAEYCVGTTAGGAQTLAWTALSPTLSAVTASGLTLLNGSTYYVSVRATSSFGFTSAAGLSAGQMVDSAVPARPVAPSVQVGQNSLLVNWTPVAAGSSGIKGYVVEYRKAESPSWFNARTKAASALALAGVGPQSVADSDLASPPLVAVGLPSGTLIFRTRAVSGAGTLGPTSEEVRIQNGGLSATALSGVAAYPNPFDSRKGNATIVFNLASSSDVSIKIFSIYGVTLKELSVAGVAGTNVVVWDGSGDSGKVSKGVYLAVITAGGAKEILKIGVIH